MSTEKIIDYVVETDLGLGHLAQYKDQKYPTLWHGDATVFTSYDAARRAIKRTRTYAKRMDFDWPWFDSARIKKAWSQI